MAFNPNQPRDAHGRFGEVANAIGDVARVAGEAAAAITGHRLLPFNPKSFARPREVTDDLIKSALGGGVLDFLERETLKAYVVQGMNLNSVLRGSKPTLSGVARKFADDLSKIIGRGKLPEDMRLLRGVTGSLTQQLEPGQIIHDKGFLSTTLSRPIANRFGMGFFNPFNPAKEGAIVRIYAKQGKTALPLPNSPLELDEVLLPRDSKIKILERRKSVLSIPERSVYDVYAELL